MKIRELVLAACIGTMIPLFFGAEASAFAANPVAYVYVQTSAGVVGYAAGSTGALTKIAGSPFATSGLMAGSKGYAFYSVGTDYIHSYALASSGAIGAQKSQINTQVYAGGSCGPAPAGIGGVLDHSGKYFYNVLTNNDYPNGCVAYQTYSIGSGGLLTFHGDSQSPAFEKNDAPFVLGNEKFAYALRNTAHLTGLMGFARETNGDLQAINFTETDPASADNDYSVDAIATDPTNHLAVILQDLGGTIYLASYTADNAGNLVSTNTAAQLPVLAYGSAMSMNPAGTLLAAGGQVSGSQPSLQVFHFNGANPPTLYKTLLAGTNVDSVGWDSSNHVYAISYATNRIYVFTVTATSVKQAPGSPYSISGPLTIFVKPL